MANPTAQDVRDELEGYGITTAVLSDAWITKKLNNFIIPFCERVTKQSFTGVKSYTEYVSGTGDELLFLSMRPIVDVQEIRYVTYFNTFSIIALAGIEIMRDTGILKAILNITGAFTSRVFVKGNKNIKVTYTYGYVEAPDDVKEAIVYLSAEQVLGFVGARTGGGALTTEGFSRDFGERGKYQDIRNDLKRQAMSILKKYSTAVIGR